MSKDSDYWRGLNVYLMDLWTWQPKHGREIPAYMSPLVTLCIQAMAEPLGQGNPQSKTHIFTTEKVDCSRGALMIISVRTTFSYELSLTWHWNVNVFVEMGSASHSQQSLLNFHYLFMLGVSWKGCNKPFCLRNEHSFMITQLYFETCQTCNMLWKRQRSF